MPDPPVATESIAGHVPADHVPAELPAFRCTLRSGDDDALWVRVVGELDIATSPQLRDALRKGEARARRMVLDLRELSFLDASGVHVIVDASHRARQSGGRLVLVRGPSPVDRLFALTGTASALDIVDLEPSRPPVQTLVQIADAAAA